MKIVRHYKIFGKNKIQKRQGIQKKVDEEIVGDFMSAWINDYQNNKRRILINNFKKKYGIISYSVLPLFYIGWYTHHRILKKNNDAFEDGGEK